MSSERHRWIHLDVSCETCWRLPCSCPEPWPDRPQRWFVRHGYQGLSVVEFSWATPDDLARQLLIHNTWSGAYNEMLQKCGQLVELATY